MLVYRKATSGRIRSPSPDPLFLGLNEDAKARAPRAVEPLPVPEHIATEVKKLNDEFGVAVETYSSRSIPFLYTLHISPGLTLLPSIRKDALKKEFDHNRTDRLELCATWNIQNHAEVLCFC